MLYSLSNSDMSAILHVLDGAAFVFVLFLLNRLKKSQRSLPLPPGPRALPLIGNVFDWPASQACSTYSRWGRTYGPLTFVRLLRRPIIIVNSAEAAFDLLERRWQNYSDRPIRPLLLWTGTARGLNRYPYGPKTLELRRLIKTVAGKAGTEERESAIVTEVHRFLRRLLDPTMEITDNVQLSVGSIILDVGYGYDVKGFHDHMLRLLMDGVHAHFKVIVMRASLPEFFPRLGHLASFIPGDHLYKVAAKVRETVRNVDAIPFAFAKEQLANGIARPSFVTEQLNDPDLSPEKEKLVRFSSAHIFFAGHETTAKVIHTLIMALMLYPEVQARAQADVDRVVGAERLPTLQDQSQLPYVVAMIKEALRFSPPAPEGVPHRVLEADEYMSYHIPKGTLIVVNIGGICQDPAEYANPLLFDPTRFLGDNPERDPNDVVFGFGRRICPGQPFAEASIFLHITALLSMFNIVKDKGSAPIDREDVSRLPMYPAPLPCHAEIRSAASRPFINSVLFRGED